MRLTLRTLLAYLDNTLEDQDVAALRAKLDESGFAIQLVQRIRASLASRELAAPSPDAVGPVEEANVISEYLDSTLPSEQVAEIERACLESDMHLAEAAACHQVLTMVLGKSAEVSPELRARIYSLPQRDIADIAVAGSFSSVAIPEQPAFVPSQDEIPTADPITAAPSNPVVPVGPEDSGVSDAPTRLREADVADAGDAAAAAGSRNRLGGDPFLGGSIRTSRITPWLVSLALAGVLLFALTRIFQPLMDQYTADSGTQDESMQLAPSRLDRSSASPQEEIEVPPEDSPPMKAVQQPAGDGEMVDAGKGSVSVDPDGSDNPVPSENVDSLPAPQPDVSPDVDRKTPQAPEATDSDDASTVPKADAPVDPPLTPTPDPKPESVSPPADASTDQAVVAASDPSPPEMKDDAESPQPPEAAAVAAADDGAVSTVTSANMLIAGHGGDNQWVWLKKDMFVTGGATVLCAPTFRARMSSETGFDVTAVGPAQVRWLRDDDGNITLQIDFGRVLIASTKPTSLQVRLGDLAVDLEFPEVESVVAASLQHFRAPGFDPLIEANRIPLSRVIVAQGLAKLTFDGDQQPLQTGQQWYQRGSEPPKTSVVDAVPDWIDEPDAAKSNLESMARIDLLKLIEGDQPLDIALREAMTFRKSEVGALAGQTLLYLGRGDAYFGGDGVLSDAKQRAYWPDHYRALLSNIDRSAESASALNDQISQMDSANAKDIFRLLTGYSQKQLVEGGDEELVRLLDSSSMAVRVLALENLRRITGTTLYFKADQDNAIRRAPDIKKWEVRQDKGDIRWQE